MKHHTLYKSIAIACLGSLGAPAAWSQAFNLFQPATGVLKGSATTYVTTAAASSDVISLWTGTCDATHFLRGDGSCQTVSGGTVTSITAGTGLTGGTITTTGTIALSTPVSVPNGGTGAATLTGIIEGNGASAFTAATQANGTALFTPAADVNSLGLGTGSLTQGGITGIQNTGFGQNALAAITSANFVTAVGFNAAAATTTGADNTAIGRDSLVSNITGTDNTGVGQGSLQNVTGSFNVGIGAGALFNNSNSSNTAVGFQTLGVGPLTGGNNVGVGKQAGTGVTSGSSNTLLGTSAGSVVTSGSSNVLVGVAGNITTGSNNILIGNSLAGTTATASNQIDIGDILFLNNTSTAVPVISSCGTSPTVDSKANNHSGTVTVGSVAAASCTITFASAYASFIHCRVTSQSSIATFAYSYTTAAITATGTSIVGDKIDYECDGL